MVKKKEVKKTVKKVEKKEEPKMEVRKERIHITKVVTRNFLVDFWAGFQNMFGQNLTGYEKMVDTAISQIEDKLKEDKINLEWYRYEITQLNNGSIAVMLYGERIKNE